MRQTNRIFSEPCWIDLYESSYFAGKLHRILGPATDVKVQGGSIITGPAARVVVKAQKGRNEQTLLRLEPHRLVPDLAKRLRGATIISIDIYTTARAIAKNRPAKRSRAKHNVI